MKMLAFFLISSVIVLITLEEVRSEKTDDGPVFYLPLISILVEPEKYDGKRVSIVGYLSGDQEPYLFLTDDHSYFSDYTSAIPIYLGDADFARCINRYARVTGRLKLESAITVAIVDVIRVEVRGTSDSALLPCYKE